MLSQLRRSHNDRLVIGIAGRIGAGKTSAGNYLRSRYGFQYLRYSQILWEWLLKDSGTKARLQEIGWEVMAGGMQLELNHRLIAQANPQGDIAVDGLRHPVDRESLKESFGPSFHLFYIESSREARWRRLESNGRYATLDAFELANSHPVEQQIELLRQHAEAVLTNDGLPEQLYLLVDEAVRRFKEEGYR